MNLLFVVNVIGPYDFNSMKASPTNLPLIDVSPLRTDDARARRAVATAIRQACLDNGFLYISGHGIDPALQARVFEQATLFFDLPMSAKRALDKSLSVARHGYDPLGGQTFNPGTPADMKEGFFIGVEAPDDGMFGHGPNQWPGGLPEFRPVMEAYMSEALDVSRLLYRGLALSLDLPEHWFDACMADPLPVLRPLHYPPQPPFNPGDALGCGEHTDFGGLTLLMQDDTGGLQVRGQSGWIEAPPLAGTYLVNIGDMITRWTNGRYRSTLHRVINRSGRARYSVPFFSNPNPDTVIACLSACLAPGERSIYPPITVADHFREMYRRTLVAS